MGIVRKIAVLLRLLIVASAPVLTQGRKEPAVRESALRQMVLYLAASDDVEKAARKMPRIADESERYAFQDTLESEFVYQVRCRYYSLNEAEQREMFVLRLKNYPALRKEATTLLRRNVAKEGFGVYIGERVIGDAYFSEKADALVGKLFAKAFARYGVKPCKRD